MIKTNQTQQAQFCVIKNNRNSQDCGGGVCTVLNIFDKSSNAQLDLLHKTHVPKKNHEIIVYRESHPQIQKYFY